MKRATLAFSLHQLESIADAAVLMAEVDAIFLEEPPEPNFASMLQENTSIDQYILSSETEYPEFTAAMCALLRKMHRNGKIILQVEPYLEGLIQIHEFFSSGGSPEQIDKNNHLVDVYNAEKKTTAALLSYYQTAAVASFKTIITAVKRFAREDSRRFILRDRMRARALLPLIRQYSNSYIEAGQIHYYLWQLLFREAANAVKVRPLFLSSKSIHSSDLARHLYSPGDILTLRYIFHPDRSFAMEDLLAARALVYNKIVWKEEIKPSVVTYPRTVDELTVIASVQQLSMDECNRAFDAIRRLKTTNARKVFADYLTSQGFNTFGLQTVPC